MKMFDVSKLLSTKENDGSAFLACAVCGYEMVHLGPVSIDQGEASFVIGRLLQVVTEEKPEGKCGSCIQLGFVCEAGHRFTMVLSFSHGSTSVYVRREADFDPETEMPHTLWRT